MRKIRNGKKEKGGEIKGRRDQKRRKSTFDRVNVV